MRWIAPADAGGRSEDCLITFDADLGVMADDQLYNRIKDIARGQGVIDIAVADAGDWETDPIVSARVKEGYRPRDIMPTARSVIVIGLPISRTIIETAPSMYYLQHYDTVNFALDLIAERIAQELRIEGHEAVYTPRDGYHGMSALKEMPEALFSHKHAAYLGGVGTFGYNNTILTKRYGPRIRFTSILTSAELPSGKPMTEQLCIDCRKCTKACPAEAVADVNYPEGLTDKGLCVKHTGSLKAKGIAPCGICIKVCPVGEDRGDAVPNAGFMETSAKFVKKPA